MTDELLLRFAEARKKYIESVFATLNAAQRKAVMATEGPLLLLAGAGSGKTTVLINRVVNLIRFGHGSDSFDVPDTVTQDDVVFLESVTAESSEIDHRRAEYLCALDPVAPWNIIAITFTNKAANELKERLSAVLGSVAQDVWAMTFHSACCRILRRDIERLGYSKNFTIYDTSDSERLMKEVIRELGLDDKTFPAKYVLSIISSQKDRFISAEQMMEDVENSGDLRLLHVARAYVKYQKHLKDNNALDFDDIIFQTVLLLKSFEDVRLYYQKKFRYILVDEYQDTNHVQYLLTSLLGGYYENVCVVGDDDQSIYRFRGATIENILDFEQQYHNARVIRLEQNYRSTQSILNAANAVISNNIGRKGKRLWTQNEAGKPIVVYQANDEGAEASFIAGEILSASKGRNFKDFAVLYRTNAQSNALEYAFKRNGIPYRVIGGMRFFDRAEVKDMLSYLCVINNRRDDLRLQRIINNPARGIGAKALEAAQRLADAEGNGLYRVVSDPYSYGPLEKYAGKFMQFTVMIEEIAALLDQGMNLLDFYDEVMVRTGYVAMLESKPTEENKTRLENIRELKSSILSYIQNTDTPTLAGFLEEIALYTDLEQYDGSDNAAVMMTMHSAKGLEFPHVFLAGFEDSLFPGMRAIGDRSEMEEERRLCYVAITRAMKSLTITHARQRMLYGKTNATLPSRFIHEIPDPVVEHKGGYYQRVDPFAVTNAHYNNQMRTRPSQVFSNAASSQPKIEIPEFKKGDMVSHTAFGSGMVLSVLKMGGDALLEIAFDKIGTKKLMAKAAASYMKRM